MAASRLIAKLTVAGDIKVLPPICSFVKEIAIQEGMPPKEAQRLEVVAEEACLNVIRHALEGNREKTFDVCIESRPAQFVLAVEDHGIPIDWKRVEKGESGGLGMILMKSFCDQVRFINLGKSGKRIEFIKNFGLPGAGNSFIEDPRFREEAPAAASMEIPIAFRRVTEDDLVPLARCMYRVYDYTYKEVVYYPEKMKEMLDAGLLVSTVGITPDGEIVAHQGLKKE